MPDKRRFELEWTKSSLADILVIRQYLAREFTAKEIENLYDLLSDFEQTVVAFPKLYPEFTQTKKLRRAVMNKNLSVYYSLRNRKIVVVSVLDNRMDYSKLL
jgi:plasmid stabilization system protein ParE